MFERSSPRENSRGLVSYKPEKCYHGYTLFSNCEINPKTGRVFWQWWADDHIAELKEAGVMFPRPVDERTKFLRGDIFHCNTPTQFILED